MGTCRNKHQESQQAPYCGAITKWRTVRSCNDRSIEGRLWQGGRRLLFLTLFLSRFGQRDFASSKASSFVASFESSKTYVLNIGMFVSAQIPVLRK
jgi:hypothetical protein